MTVLHFVFESAKSKTAHPAHIGDNAAMNTSSWADHWTELLCYRLGYYLNMNLSMNLIEDPALLALVFC